MDIPRVLKQQVVSQNKFFRHITDSLELNTGGSYDYHYLDCTYDAVVVIPVNQNGSVILERIYRHPYADYIYEFPAGGIEQGEDPCVAGARELQEETGYEAQSVVPLQSFGALPGLLHMQLHFVLATELEYTGDLERDALELMDVETVTLETAWQYTTNEHTSSFLTIGLLAYEQYRRLHNG